MADEGARCDFVKANLIDFYPPAILMKVGHQVASGDNPATMPALPAFSYKGD
jgi:hypothetical protein